MRREASDHGAAAHDTESRGVGEVDDGEESGMPTKALGRRLSRLGQAGRTEEIGQIVIIAPDEWPIEAQTTYEAACVAGDRERQADIIETQTGERPVFPRLGVGLIRDHLPIAVVEICTPSGGLQ